MAFEFQPDAIEQIVEGLSLGGRGQLVAACGSGKTRVARRAVERLVGDGGLVVVTVPSLLLVAQTREEWRGAAARVLAVCSDDELASGAADADVYCVVTTEAAVLAEWLREPASGRRLVLSTYHSAAVAGRGLREAGCEADLLIVDEAHRTAGPAQKPYAVVHDDTRFPARRRLYMTATPRIHSRGRGDRETVASMDDPDVFGEVLYRYPFPRAIADGVLDDYRLAVIGVTNQEVLAWLGTTGRDHTTDVLRSSVQAAVLQAALAQAALKWGVRRAIAFCRRVAEARELARTFASTLALLPDDRKPQGELFAAAIDGSMHGRQRRLLLDRLASPPEGGWTVLSCAKVLNEGVDVPAVDCVAFRDPKESVIDIVQAVGRALRRDRDGTGTATILVPILLPDDEHDLHDVDDPAGFETLWNVVRALRAHDDELAQQLDLSRSGLGRTPDAAGGDGVGWRPAELPPRFRIELPAGYGGSFLASLTVRIVEAATDTWWEHLGRARAYYERHGHLRIPVAYETEDGTRLGEWILNQRQRCTRPERREALEAIGMVWDPLEAQWLESYEHARAYQKAHGHLRVPATYETEDGTRLGEWIVRQRKRCTRPERREALEAIGMIWDARKAQWLEGYEHARAYQQTHGHLRVPRGFRTSDDFPLGQWITSQRELCPRLERRQALEAIGMVWDPLEAQWLESYEHARAYHQTHGHLRIRTTYETEDGTRLGQWINAQRKRCTRPERREALEAIGMIWDPLEAQWLEG